MKTCWKRLAMLVAVLAALMVTALAADTPAAFFEEMERDMRAQKQNFSITYTADAEADGLLAPPEAQLAVLQRLLSAQSPDGADCADSVAMNLASGCAVFRDGAFHFSLTYLSTPAQLAEVSRLAGDIIRELALTEESDFTKIKLIYEYVCTHFTYDETLTKFSAYDGLTSGTMVCQGYALLLRELLQNAGVPSRIVSGTSQAQAHAWNIVKLGGVWYNLDATWDGMSEEGGAMGWHFFLKSTGEFTGHTRHEAYTTAAYEQAHPMSPTSAVLPRIVLLTKGEKVSGMILRCGVEVQLVARLPDGAASSEIRWVSADPTLVTVSPHGQVVANRVGATYISVTVTEGRGIISARLPVQSVDLTGASPWAFDTVTQFYLNQLLPSTLCADFQQGITRGEFARMLDLFVVKTRGFDSFSIHNDYTDIGDCPDGLSILNCKATGLMEGLSPTRFGPNEVLTREQASKSLVRLMEFLDDAQYTAPDTAAYADAAEISDWAVPFVAAATHRGVLQGTGAGFCPRQSMTREQAALALARVYEPWAVKNPPQKAA